MSPRCTKIDELLERGDTEAMSELERHAAACVACAEDLREWNAISVVARDLHAEWKSPSLWPRIERAISDSRSRRGTVIAFTGRPLILMQIAATLLLVAGLAAITGRLLPPVASPSPIASFDSWVLRESAIDDVERAEKTHLASIERLSRLVAPTLENDDSALVFSYREKLMLLDEAIAECQSQIEKNRYNAHLRRQLLAVYQEKDRTLRDVLEEENREQ